MDRMTFRVDLWSSVTQLGDRKTEKEKKKKKEKNIPSASVANLWENLWCCHVFVVDAFCGAAAQGMLSTCCLLFLLRPSVHIFKI